MGIPSDVVHPVPPRLPYSRSDSEVAVNVGGQVRMECNASRGIPEPRISWLKDGQPLPDPSRSRSVRLLRAGRILQMRSASVDDTGVYTCVVKNKAGQDQRRYILSVNGSVSCVDPLLTALLSASQ